MFIGQKPEHVRLTPSSPVLREQVSLAPAGHEDQEVVGIGHILEGWDERRFEGRRHSLGDGAGGKRRTWAFLTA